MSKTTDTKATTETTKPLDANSILADLAPDNDAEITGGCIVCGPCDRPGID